ncbi:MAG: carbon-nitrogen family hydrolase [Acidimicrobiales bacterium]
MNIVLAQLAVDLAEPKGARVKRVCDLLAGPPGLPGPAGQAGLVVLPEMWPTGYHAFDRYEAEAEPLDGPTATALGEAALAMGAWLHAGSMVERDAAGSGPAGPGPALYNTSLLFGPDGTLVHTQRKVHLFGHESRETDLLRPATGVGVYRAPFAGLGLATCYDLRFPELFRVMVDAGAELLLVAAAWPAARLDHWRLLARARAVENQCFVAACNTAGTQAGVELGGHSLVVDPWGVVVAEAGDGEEMLAVDVDLARVAAVRAELPVLADRRLAVPPTLGPGR